jgi:tyrosyl-tRNA synthetase
MIGDPSGKTELRQMLTRETIAANAKGIEPQVRRFLGDAGDRALLVDNADWLLPLNYIEFLRDIGRHFSVNRMLAAEAYKLRIEKGLSFIEFNYQILQAYDFLTLKRRHGCALQIGGDDQWGNILAGTDLIRRLDQAEAYGLTFPLITTAAGAKMGKTAAGAVWLAADRTSAFDFYQYFVNVDDRDVVRFLKLLTFLPMSEIERLAALQGAEIRVAKQALAFAVTEIVHGREAAESAQKAAQAAFGGGDAGNLVPTFETAAGVKIVDLLAAAGLAASKSAARRLVEQGGVKVGERKIASVDDVLQAEEVGSDGVLLHAGKKHLKRIVIK